MKKICVTLILAALVLPVVGQRKMEFGFTVKGGNHNFSKAEAFEVESIFTRDRAHSYEPGAMYALGLWHGVRLNDQLRVSWELLYRSAFLSLTMRENSGVFFLSNPDGTVGQETIVFFSRDRVKSSSIFLPVKIEFFPKGDSRFSFFLGAGASRKLSETVHSSIEVKSLSGLLLQDNLDRKIIPADNFSMNTSLTGGLYFHIDPKTSLGLEYIYEASESIYYTPPTTPIFPSIFVRSYHSRPTVHSFSLSLRHNIRD